MENIADRFIHPGARGYIYLLTFGNGKHYVGLTNNFERRIKQHKSDSVDVNNKLYNAWKKYKGPIAEEVIFTCRQSDLKEFEIHFIAEYDSHRNGYNSTPGGDASPHDYPEGRANHKAAFERLKADPVWREAQSNRMRAVIAKRDANTSFKAEQSERTKRMVADPAWKAAQSERAKRQYADPAFKAAQSEMMKKMHTDPEYRAALSNGARMSLAIRSADFHGLPYSLFDARQKKRWADEDAAQAARWAAEDAAQEAQWSAEDAAQEAQWSAERSVSISESISSAQN